MIKCIIIDLDGTLVNTSALDKIKKQRRWSEIPDHLHLCTPYNEAIDVLNMWAEFIYAPLLEDRVRPIQSLRNGSAGRDLAGKVHGELKRIGGIRPPREFVLMDRAAVGLGSVCSSMMFIISPLPLFHSDT